MHCTFCRIPTYSQGSGTPWGPRDPDGIRSTRFSSHPPRMVSTVWVMWLPAVCAQPRPAASKRGEHPSAGHLQTGCAPVEWTVCNQTRPKHAGERDPHNAIQGACGKWCLCSFVCLWCEISHSINTVCGHSLICANRQSIRNITA